MSRSVLRRIGSENRACITEKGGRRETDREREE